MRLKYLEKQYLYSLAKKNLNENREICMVSQSLYYRNRNYIYTPVILRSQENS